MKYIVFMCLIPLIGCITRKASTPSNSRRHSVSIVYKIDTLERKQCLYSTTQIIDSNYTGYGSIITRCGCFFVGEEVNHDCITSQQSNGRITVSKTAGGCSNRPWGAMEVLTSKGVSTCCNAGVKLLNRKKRQWYCLDCGQPCKTKVEVTKKVVDNTLHERWLSEMYPTGPAWTGD